MHVIADVRIRPGYDHVMGVSEVRSFCAKCGDTTEHRAASDGSIHCMRCIGDNVPGLTAPPPGLMQRSDVRDAGMTIMWVGIGVVATIAVIIVVATRAGSGDRAVERRVADSDPWLHPVDATVLPNADMRVEPPKRARGNLDLRLRFARDVTTIQQSMGAARNVRIRVDGTVLVFDGDPGCDREGLRKILDGIAGFDDFAPAGFTELRCGAHGDVLPLEW